MAPSLIHPVDPKYLNQWYGEDFTGWIGGVLYAKVYRDRFGLPNGHPGIDYAVFEGTPVKAAAAGTIEFADWGDNWAGSNGTVGGGSFTVVIDHGDYYTAYLHLKGNSNRFRVGQKVKQGDVIALSGNTGVGNGPHLHWQYMPKPVNFWDGQWGTRDQKPYINTVFAAADTIEGDALSAAEVKEIKDFIKADNDRVLRTVGSKVWSYDQGGKTPQAWHFQKNVGAEVWGEKLKDKTGRLFSAAAFVVNNNFNIWAILPIVKSIAAKIVGKSELDAAVKEVNDHTTEAMADSVVDVVVTVKEKDKINDAV